MKKAKSLLRVSESVEQIRWRLQYGAASQDKSPIDNQIVVSNDKSLEGTNVEDTLILNSIMERGTGKKIIHAKAESSTFGHNFGLMEKSRDYYIYAFMNERKVFTSTFFVVWRCCLPIRERK